jgi:hypothetical protein
MIFLLRWLSRFFQVLICFQYLLRLTEISLFHSKGEAN